jgi:hypothetical protein
MAREEGKERVHEPSRSRKSYMQRFDLCMS